MLITVVVLLVLASTLAQQDDVCYVECDMPWCLKPVEELPVTVVDILEPNLKNLVVLGGRQYYFCTESFSSHDDAVRLCRELGMRLISIETEAENEHVKQRLQDMNKGMEWFWTSGRRLNDKWIWVTTGSPFNFTDWLEGRPEFSAPEDRCLNLSGVMHWWDDPCTFRWHFICEQKD